MPTHPLVFLRQIQIFLKSTYAIILMLQFIFQNFPMNWNKELSYQRIKWSQSYLRKIIYLSKFVKLNLLIVEVVTHPRICRDFEIRSQINNPVARNITIIIIIIISYPNIHKVSGVKISWGKCPVERELCWYYKQSGRSSQHKQLFKGPNRRFPQNLTQTNSSDNQLVC